jgi:hypothetical protein
MVRVRVPGRESLSDEAGELLPVPLGAVEGVSVGPVQHYFGWKENLVDEAI